MTAQARDAGTTGVPVLVVDDNAEFLDVVCAALARTPPGFVVFGVESGTKALAFLRREPPFAHMPRPAFVVLDLRLPDLDAPDVLRRLAAQGDLDALPVLVVSQAGWAEDAVAIERAGATAFHLKPSRVQALRTLIVDFWKEHVDGATAGHRGRP
jgi:DNA-binding response OmpR family regulator